MVATDLNEPDDRLRAFQVDWRTADAAALPFPSSSFGIVACQFGLMFIPDKQAAFPEARRVLIDGGLLAFNVWDSFEHNAFGRIAHETISGFFAADPPTFYQVPFGFHDPDQLLRLLEGNGFGRVELARVKSRITVLRQNRSPWGSSEVTP